MDDVVRTGFLGAGLIATYHSKSLRRSGAHVERAGLAADAGVVDHVGLVLRRSAAFLWARHLIDDPSAGRMMSVVFRERRHIVIDGDDWTRPVSWADADHTGGSMADDDLDGAAVALEP